MAEICAIGYHLVGKFQENKESPATQQDAERGDCESFFGAVLHTHFFFIKNRFGVKITSDSYYLEVPCIYFC